MFAMAIEHREADVFWSSDEVSLRNLNDPFYRNTFRLGGRACSFASLFLVVFRP